jgi:hypothetical protein
LAQPVRSDHSDIVEHGSQHFPDTFQSIELPDRSYDMSGIRASASSCSQQTVSLKLSEHRVKEELLRFSFDETGAKFAEYRIMKP